MFRPITPLNQQLEHVGGMILDASIMPILNIGILIMLPCISKPLGIALISFLLKMQETQNHSHQCQGVVKQKKHSLVMKV
mgnify:FL=1